MFGYRIYVAVLTLVYLSLTLFASRLGLLEGAVITCALLFQVLDIRKDTEEIKHLKAQIASLERA